MSKYAEMFNPAVTPQSERIPGRPEQVMNSAGGYVFAIDKWSRLDRFLILGSEAPTYYSNAKDLTRTNATSVLECWGEDPARTSARITDVSQRGRAPKQSPVIFALALGAVHKDEAARQFAYSAVSAVCRTASHLFEFVDTRQSLKKGWGRGIKRAIADWYGKRDADQLAFQGIKYRNRNNFTHKRLIEVAHKGAGVDIQRQGLYQWLRGKEVEAPLPMLVWAHIAAMATEKAKDLIPLIVEHRLPWEAIPTWALKDKDVWKVLARHIGLTALIRNLGNMTECGAITMQDDCHVRERLGNAMDLKRARVHPFSILQALAVYRSGHGVRGSKSWTPQANVIDALDRAFYLAFESVEPTGKRILLALDVSGSMGSQMSGSPITCREAAAAMALVTLATEPDAQVVGFTSGLRQSMHGGYGVDLTTLPISARQRLDDVVRTITGIPFGGTDCSLPYVKAAEMGWEYDAFIVYTDSETWAGVRHPVQALQAYRQRSGINAKSVVVAMTSTGFSIADPEDGGMLDVVGFDSAAPALISDFITN